MVIKTFRCGLWTGNTIRQGIWRNYITNDGYIEFQVYNADGDWAEADLDEALWELDDGLQGESKPLAEEYGRGLNSSPRDIAHVQFSLKKRKRWLFQDEVKHNMHYFQRKFFRLVVARREMTLPHSFMFTYKTQCTDSWVNRHCDVCLDYMDSKACLQIFQYAQSSFPDLRRVAVGDQIRHKVKDEWRGKDSLRRGVQRKSDIIQRLPQSERKDETKQYNNEE
jgi:hypothetical protein